MHPGKKQSRQAGEENDFIDTDVFVIDLRYRRDEKYGDNKVFLDQAASSGATTSYYNILEVCGTLSFNLNREQLFDLYYHFPRRYNLKEIRPLKPQELMPAFSISSLMNVMSTKASFGDTLVICSAKELGERLDYFVSWNAEHIKGKLDVDALTPVEYLLRQDKSNKTSP